MPERRSKSLGRELERRRVVAFGSTTPRDLSYLTNIPWQYRVYDVKLPNLKVCMSNSPSQNEPNGVSDPFGSANTGANSRRPPRPYTARVPSAGRSRPTDKKSPAKQRPKTTDSKKVRIRRSSSTGSIVNEPSTDDIPRSPHRAPPAARAPRPPSAQKSKFTAFSGSFRVGMFIN